MDLNNQNTIICDFYFENAIKNSKNTHEISSDNF